MNSLDVRKYMQSIKYFQFKFQVFRFIELISIDVVQAIASNRKKFVTEPTIVLMKVMKKKVYA